ncbi:uncharacterized protein METZ01_LOCUS111508 [marine metagenome]|uniref:DUF177 domain-containing protein n=1 Tax=marine metagenome TaxID=408172 RepID=A0A381X1L9_9ZZZZ
MITKITPEFSRLISIIDIEADGIKINISANSLECDALAKRFSVKHVQRLSAKLIFSKPKGESLPNLEARYIAEITQICVVTLEPMTSIIESKFFCTLAEKEASNIDEELVFTVNDVDPPEYINNGFFDAGELVSEHLLLEIDPFPRVVGAEFCQSNIFSTTKVKYRFNPFEKLKKLQTKE